jgi:Peptidase family M28
MLLLPALWSALSLASVTSAQPTDTVTSDIRSFVTGTNEARLQALTKILEREHLPFTTQKFVNAGGLPGTNVIVDIGPGGQDFIVSAHYDAAEIPSGVLSQGAIDNAAGVIALIHAAGRLKSETPRHRVRFIFFDQEELGLLGSTAFLSSNHSQTIRANLNVDIVGYGDTAIYGPSEGAPSENDAVAAMRRTCEERNCLRFQEMPPGDDISFSRASIPAVSMAILPFNEATELREFLEEGQPESGTLPPILSLIHTKNDRVELVQRKTIDLATDLIVEWVGTFDRR